VLSVNYSPADEFIKSVPGKKLIFEYHIFPEVGRKREFFFLRDVSFQKKKKNCRFSKKNFADSDLNSAKAHGKAPSQ
jgi:hypothetical protein